MISNFFVLLGQIRLTVQILRFLSLRLCGMYHSQRFVVIQLQFHLIFIDFVLIDFKFELTNFVQGFGFDT